MEETKQQPKAQPQLQPQHHREFSTSWWPGNPPIRDANITTPHATGIGQKSFTFDLDPGSEEEEGDEQAGRQGTTSSSTSVSKRTIEISSNFCSGNIIRKIILLRLQNLACLFWKNCINTIIE